MEIAQIAPGCIRIKGKQATVLIDPTPLIKAKLQADAVLLSSSSQEYDAAKIENVRLVVTGPGEYEISGVKITGNNAKDGICYLVRVDNVEVFYIKASDVEKNIDMTLVKPICVINADAALSDTSGISDNNPVVIVACGEQATQVGGAFGKEGIQAVTKYQTTSDKLPAELEVVILE